MSLMGASLTILAALLGAATLLWLLSLKLNKASIADPAWGLGFVLLAWLALVLARGVTPRGALVVSLVTVWGARLFGFLCWRSWGHVEDYRYAAMRAHHGARFRWVSLGTVFWLQALLVWFISWPVQWTVAQTTVTTWGVLDAVGTLLWLVGLLFESIGDWQLARFKSDPANAGKVLDRGLWRYTRHPNYFGDFCVWWGLYLINFSAGGFAMIASPIVMTLLLWKVSGVALLEQTIVERRPEYAAYRRRTNAFFPGPPRADHPISH